MVRDFSRPSEKSFCCGVTISSTELPALWCDVTISSKLPALWCDVTERNIGNVSKATLGKGSERPGGAQMGFSERTDTILN